MLPAASRRRRLLLLLGLLYLAIRYLLRRRRRLRAEAPLEPLPATKRVSSSRDAAPQEIAHNVLEYYAHQRDLLRRGVAGYSEAQGKGFICWRFLNEHMR